MKKQIPFYLLAILVSTFTQTICGQSEKEALQKAANYYKNLDYVQAINAYESIARKGVETQELLENLANAYY